MHVYLHTTKRELEGQAQKFGGGGARALLPPPPPVPPPLMSGAFYFYYLIMQGNHINGRHSGITRIYIRRAKAAR